MHRSWIFPVGLFAALTSLLPAPAVAVPAIQYWTTANGARIYFAPAPELPMVDVRIVFDAGSARDGELPGLAQLTNTLLDSGTAALSADTVAERLDGVGARLSGGAARDMAWLSLRSLTDDDYLVPAIDTVARLLKAPAFTAESLERERNRMLAVLQGIAQSPRTLAEQAFYQGLYGEHPYASPPEGTPTSLAAISREDVRAFYHRYYVAANAVVAIVGDLDREAAENLALALMGGLPAGDAAPSLPPVEPVTEPRVIRVAYPSAQSHIHMGQVGIERGNPDYYSLYLSNQVLGGGGLVSILTDEIREKRGLSYGVYSYFIPMNRQGPFLIGLQTRNDQVTQAVEVTQATLQRFVATGPDPEALETARQNIVDGFPLRIDSNGKIVQYLAMMGFYGLPLDYLATFPGKIEALSRDQLIAALQRHIRPEKLLTVIVGGE